MRFLSRYPSGHLAERAQRRVETLRFKAAQRADRPLGFNAYLLEYPGGRYGKECRNRLVEIAFKRDLTVAQLLLIVERYPDTPQARQAEQLLPKARAKLALASDDPAILRAFLERHPDDSQAQKVRVRLASIISRTLPVDQNALESFVQQFAGTPAAQAVLKRLETRLADELRESRDESLLEQFKIRFPESHMLPELSLLVLQRQLMRAITLIDTKQIEALEPSAGATDRQEVKRLRIWCHRYPQKCMDLRKAALLALPWQPALSLQTLHQQAYDPDMMIAWKAIFTLGLITDQAAGEDLIEMIGSSRFSMIWAVEQALSSWLSRLSPQQRQGWATRQLRRSFRLINDDEAQRRGYLKLVATGGGEGYPLLHQILSRSDRSLPVSYLLLRHEERQGNAAPKRYIQTFIRTAGSRTKWLKEAFPSELNTDSLIPALLAERELYAIWRALEGLIPPATPQEKLEQLKPEVLTLLRQWQAQIQSISKTYQPASHELVGPEAETHDKGRAAVLQELWSKHGAVGKTVARSICAIAPIPQCVTILPGTEKVL